MREPREALEAARRAAAAARDAGAEQAAVEPGAHADDDEAAGRVGDHRARRALEVYSTRRFGRPITAFKRLLIRLLYQYLGQISAQQSRFNAHLAAHVLQLEERVRALEEAVAGPRDPSRSTSTRDPAISPRERLTGPLRGRPGRCGHQPGARMPSAVRAVGMGRQGLRARCRSGSRSAHDPAASRAQPGLGRGPATALFGLCARARAPVRFPPA